MITHFKQFSRLGLVGLLALIIGLQSCYKTNYTTSNPAGLFDNSKTVVSSIYGVVQDEAGMPVVSATVRSGVYTTQTDDNGLFFFNNIITPSHASSVVVSKTGYFNGSRTLSVKANDKHTIKIVLMDKGIPQTFSAGNGGTVNFSGGLSITFPSNIIVNKMNGMPYTGQVYVYAKSIDPTTEMGRNTMPGDLRGIGQYGGERVLESFGMLVAELYDVNGNELQIAPASTATLSQTIPASLMAVAKSTIPMWYFDEVKGMWIEEGSAILQGNKYEAKVGHFTYWNYDAQLPSIQVEMVFQDQNGFPLQNYWVSLHNANNAGAHGNTSASGWIGGPAQANAVLTLNVYNNGGCGNMLPVYTTTITTGAANMNLGIITVNLAPNMLTSFDATIQDCLGAPVTNGGLYISALNLWLTPNALGQVSYSLPCTPAIPLNMHAYDFSGNVYGSSTVTLTPGMNNLGVLTACGNLAPFFTIDLTNTVSLQTHNQTYVLPVDSLFCSIQGINTYITVSSLNGFISMIADGNTAGTFNVSAGNVSGVGPFTDALTLTGINNVTFTFFPAFPGAVEGSYSMNFIGAPSGDTYTATGTFRIPRNN